MVEKWEHGTQQVIFGVVYIMSKRLIKHTMSKLEAQNWSAMIISIGIYNPCPN